MHMETPLAYPGQYPVFFSDPAREFGATNLIALGLEYLGQYIEAYLTPMNNLKLRLIHHTYKSHGNHTILDVTEALMKIRFKNEQVYTQFLLAGLLDTATGYLATRNESIDTYRVDRVSVVPPGVFQARSHFFCSSRSHNDETARQRDARHHNQRGPLNSSARLYEYPPTPPRYNDYELDARYASLGHHHSASPAPGLRGTAEPFVLRCHHRRH
ncbi:hypothetical protein C8R45DRAFT_930999 [Mycena sanguinolenta]|nr:hypothetical protein C8R45DRAFT_930999 [Mycena sanguinolenta]